MAKTVRPDQLADEIMRILHDYTSEVIEKINVSGEQIAKDGAAELKRTSPKDTGDYAKSWKVKREAKPGQLTTFTIYSGSPHYRLTHLLEKGHAKRGGGRVAARPHIKPVEELVVNKYIRSTEEAIRRGG